MTLSLRKSLPYFFLLLPIPVFFILTRSNEFLANADLISIGITVDLVFVIPLLYFLLIRNRKIPNTAVFPVFILGVVLASLLLPQENQYYLSLVKTWLIPVAELTVFSFLVWKVSKVVKTYNQLSNRVEIDFYTALKQTVAAFFPSFAAHAITMEISIFYYGFFQWTTQKPKSNSFTYHKNSSARIVLGTLIFLVIAETFVIHILLMNWSLPAAWILTGLSVYSVFQVFGILRSLAARPHCLQEDFLDLRFGIMNECVVQYDQIESVLLSSQEMEEGTFRSLSPLGSLDPHNVILKFKTLQTISGLYGGKNKTSVLALQVDRPDVFVAAVQEKMITS